MKRKLIFIITFIFTFLCFQGFANATNYYNEVIVKTTFEDNIDLNAINEIEIHLEDATEFSKDYLLEKAKNFELAINDVPVGPYKFMYGVVIGDNIGYYSVLASVNIDENNSSVQVLVNVTESNKNNNNTSLTQEEIDRITSGNSVSTTTKVVDSGDNSGLIIEDENKEEKEEETTTIPKDIEEARKKEQQEEKRKQNRAKNNLIGKIMFFTIGIALLIVIIYATIKISNANK
ncbi:MAG: hypothetical protein HFI73_04685 [Bacilli bacterium]|nr:hypothetical protein [Bacilli bacterium]